MNLSFEAFSKQHIAQAVQLVLDELAQERTHCPALPQNDFTDRLTGLLSWLAEQRYGQAAVCEGRLMGYLVFAGPWDGVLGHAKGVFSPLGGSAIARPCQDRAYLASMLLESVANRLVAEGVYSIEIARFAHDETVARSLVLNGFGIRCCDAVQRVDCLSGEGAPSGVVLTELPRDAFAAVRPLQQGLHRHLAKAPVFLPHAQEGFDEWFDRWIHRERMRIFVAMAGEKPLGFLSVDDDGENVLTECDCMKNICGAYVDEGCRGSGLAHALLRYMADTLGREGVTHLGVDCETMNPTALRFWGKHFRTYTYSFARRIDERACVT